MSMHFVETLKRYADGARILTDWIGEGGHTVDQVTAQKRADTCLKCVQNQSGFALADSVSEHIREEVELKNHLKLRVRGEKSLLTCAACLCPLRLKIWLPIEKVNFETQPEELTRLDPQCWILKELKQSQ